MNKYYYKDGATSQSLDYTKVFHRTDGPAIEYADGDKYWWVDDKLHRVDGPAIEYADGAKEWWVDGIQYSEKQFEALIEEIRNLDKALKLTDPREWVRKVVIILNSSLER